MKYDTIFWDWNGTIIDDLDTCITCVNSLLNYQGLKEFTTHEEYYNVFCFPIIEYYRKAGFDFNKDSYEVLANMYIDKYKVLCNDCKVFSDILDIIKEFKKAGIRQVILSASEKTELVSWIKRLGIYELFDDVIAIDNIYARSKVDVAKDWLKSHPDVDTKKCIMIGDTTHDGEVATSMGIDVAYVARGHNRYSDLEKENKPLFKDGVELKKFLLE